MAVFFVNLTFIFINLINFSSPHFLYFCLKEWIMKLSHLSETLIGSVIVNSGSELKEKICPTNESEILFLLQKHCTSPPQYYFVI